jgi:hypothetical protein
MQKGFNTDFNVGSSHVHVQTEDWGSKNPFIVTKVFKNGAVVQTLKTPYEKVLPFGPISDEQAIRLAMQEQHQKILDHLLSGQIGL